MNPLSVVENILREIFDDETLVITPNTAPTDVAGWDSVAQVKIVLALESEFGIRFTTDQVSTFKQVGDFLRAIEAHHR